MNRIGSPGRVPPVSIEKIFLYLELMVSLKRTGLRQRVDRRMLVQVHAALFPNVRLMTVSERSIRSATLTVAVTHPGTNLHNCCLTSDSDLTAI